jgi:hypothetical protein
MREGAVVNLYRKIEEYGPVNMVVASFCIGIYGKTYFINICMAGHQIVKKVLING